jgi:hypothetical protein
MDWKNFSTNHATNFQAILCLLRAGTNIFRKSQARISSNEVPVGGKQWMDFALSKDAGITASTI